MLNVDENFCLPFGPEPSDKKQIDVVAIDNDSVLLVECKSSAASAKPPSFKTEFEALRSRLDGYRKAIDQTFGPGRRIKYIFATRKLRLSRDSTDVERLVESGGFYYNDNTFQYVDSLLKAYRDAAHYQFMGLIMKGQSINKEKIEVPAIEGTMGGKTYYMFSLEPQLLLKIGFVLHRTRANESEMPTYQRLLVPSRLKGITKFIDNGGSSPIRPSSISTSATPNSTSRASNVRRTAYRARACSRSRTRSRSPILLTASTASTATQTRNTRRATRSRSRIQESRPERSTRAVHADQ